MALPKPQIFILNPLLKSEMNNQDMAFPYPTALVPVNILNHQLLLMKKWLPNTIKVKDMTMNWMNPLGCAIVVANHNPENPAVMNPKALKRHLVTERIQVLEPWMQNISIPAEALVADGVAREIFVMKSLAKPWKIRCVGIGAQVLLAQNQ